nr:unnamed protein product [Callosobruchus analis]
MKESTVLNWVKLDKSQEAERRSNDKRGEARRNHYQSRSLKLIDFFKSPPKLESHYCPSSSSKLYLEPMWSSINELYKFYSKHYCDEDSITPVSKTAFFEEFNKENLSIYIPKKDMCDICVAYDTRNIGPEEYDLHQAMKKEAREEKNRDKESATAAAVFTMDLEAILPSPRSTVSKMYYKMKLVVHNFTLFNLKTQDGYYFLWHEAKGGLTANEFSSILCNFLENAVIPNLSNDNKIIILYSDGCTGQNRNCILANTFVNLCMLHEVTIIQKYFEKGHTQVEVDSMHSCIEKKIRNRKINIPADYAHACKIARTHPKPHDVKYLTHEFFKKFDDLNYYKSIRHRTATVTRIRALKYDSTGKIFFKLRHTDSWELLNQRIKLSEPRRTDSLQNLYLERRKIKKDKYEHLQILKSSLLSDFHDFYDNLPHD